MVITIFILSFILAAIIGLFIYVSIAYKNDIGINSLRVHKSILFSNLKGEKVITYDEVEYQYLLKLKEDNAIEKYQAFIREIINDNFTVVYNQENNTFVVNG